MNKVLCLSCFGFLTCPTGSCTEVTPNSPVERWALKNAKKASAEEIIVAAVVQSFAKDFDNWVAKSFSDPKAAWDYDSGTLINEKKHVIIKRTVQKKFNREGPDRYRFQDQVTINDVIISPALSKLVVKHWEKVYVEIQRTTELADKIKNEMDVTEKAWNLAENLLGMKRVNGALVPKETVE